MAYAYTYPSALDSVVEDVKKIKETVQKLSSSLTKELSPYQMRLNTTFPEETDIVIAGKGGTASANKEGILLIQYWDKVSKRMRIKTGYVGEQGIEPNETYYLNERNEFTRVI